jgi:hypothetical protein
MCPRVLASLIFSRTESQRKTGAAAAFLCPNLVAVKELLYTPVEVDVKAVSSAVVSKREAVEPGQDQTMLWRLNIGKCELMLIAQE